MIILTVQIYNTLLNNLDKYYMHKYPIISNFIINQTKLAKTEIRVQFSQPVNQNKHILFNVFYKNLLNLLCSLSLFNKCFIS